MAEPPAIIPEADDMSVLDCSLANAGVVQRVQASKRGTRVFMTKFLR
jgi:hypothetical protein